MEPEVKRTKWTSPDDTDDSKMEEDLNEISEDKSNEMNEIVDESKNEAKEDGKDKLQSNLSNNESDEQVKEQVNKLNEANTNDKMHLSLQSDLIPTIDNNMIVSVFGQLAGVLNGIQETNKLILNEVKSKSKDNESVANNQIIHKQINTLVKVKTTSTTKDSNKQTTQYNLFIKFNEKGEIAKIRQEIRDAKLLDGEEPITIESSNVDYNLNEYQMTFRVKSDLEKVYMCLKDKFSCSETGNEIMDRTISERYVIYGFAYQQNKTHIELKNNLLRFNRAEINGQRIFNKQTLNIDASKFHTECGTAAIIEFYGESAINSIT